MGGQSVGILEGGVGWKIERYGECESEMHGWEQMETSVVATPLKEFSGTGTRLDQIG